MLSATLASSKDELLQIEALNKINLKQNLDAKEKEEQGFVTWLYPLPLLEQMHNIAPSVIVKDGNKVVGYALATIKEARSFHSELNDMFNNIEKIELHGKPLFTYHFYCMGQICIDKQYRGKGLVNTLYQKHKEVYSNQYEFLLTEISTTNHRSLNAHRQIGFKTVHTHKDGVDEWDVVIWEWN